MIPRIAGFRVDVFVEEKHDLRSEVTSYQVESGSDISDNIRNLPAEVTVSGVVSDTPIGATATERTPGTLPTEDALALLIKIRNDREPVTIETALQRYDNMALLSLNMPLNANTGEALRFQAVFRQIEFITNERTLVVVEQPRSEVKQDRGSKTSPESEAVPETTKRKASILHKLFN